MDKESRHGGTINIVCREESVWQIIGAKIFGANVVIFKIMAGQKRWYVIGAYLSPNDHTTVHHVEQAISKFPAWA